MSNQQTPPVRKQPSPSNHLIHFNVLVMHFLLETKTDVFLKIKTKPWAIWLSSINSMDFDNDYSSL